jgi:predicted DNA-binding transcriptional regulator YafY
MHETERNAEVAGTAGIKTWVMGWAANAKILEPESLRDDIRSEIYALAELYEMTDHRINSRKRFEK